MGVTGSPAAPVPDGAIIPDDAAGIEALSNATAEADTAGTGVTDAGTADASTARRFGTAGLVIVAATTLALAIRTFTLVRGGFLTGISEYDDGVYLGAAIRLTEGVMPYRGFAFVQPPGILLLMSPVAAIARITTTVKALALARVLTVMASVACVPLAGRLVRHRGAVTTLVTCGTLAVYPGDIASAHTLMLEPWLNLCCLLGATAAFRRGTLTSPRRLAVAGLIFGFAGAIKFWAIAPALAVAALCLIAPGESVPGGRLWGLPASGARLRRLLGYLPGLVVGFCAPVFPFLLSAPGAFLHGTITDQAVRAGTAVPIDVRLAYLTGIVDIVDSKGQFSPAAGAGSMYAQSAAPVIAPGAGVDYLSWIAVAVLVALLAAGYAVRARHRAAAERLSHLDWMILSTAVLAAVAVLSYSAFFYHYADFPGPWLALASGTAAGALLSRAAWRTTVLSAIASMIVAVAVLQSWETHSYTEPTAQSRAFLIPKNACLVTDEVSLAIDADRFAQNPPGCPVIVDSLAATLVLANGVSVQAGASSNPAVVAQWKAWLSQADYVWLSPGDASLRRIPWTPALQLWFHQTFKPLGSDSVQTGQLYKRVH
jgi:hypothetical protein